jgi:photosystem II stability/assembly factor-like uncharacterized protein
MNAKILPGLTKLIFALLFCFSDTYPQLQDILNSITTDSLMTTMKELTGASPVFINGRIDTIKTRAHLTTYNRRAQNYIKEKLERYGIHTETRNYYTWSPRDWVESYTKAVHDGNQYWFCTNWGEIFKTSTFPLIESKNISGIPFEHSLDWIVLEGADTIVSVGKRGYLQVSTDGGDTWKKRNTGYAPITGVVKSDIFIIAAANEGKILRTSNLGESWTSVTINDLFKINNLIVTSDNIIIAAGRDSITNSGTVYISSDKGSTWSSASGTFPEPFISGTSSIEHSWMLAKNGKVFHSGSAGEWTQIYSPDTIITAKKIFFSDSLNGWIVSHYNDLYKTTDKGYNWNFAAHLVTPSVIEDIHFTDSLNGIITGKQHYGVVTSDGGNTWTDKTIPLPFVVVGFIPGTSDPEKTILLASHTDCIIGRYVPSGFEIAHGADDNGSGTTALIELARVFKQYPLNYTLAFSFIPTEELGWGGCAEASELVFENTDSVVFGLDPDMIGYDSLDQKLLNIGYNNSVAERAYHNFKNLLNSTGVQLNLIPHRNVSVLNICNIPDLPTFWIMEGGFPMNSNYHDITDTWNSLNYSFFTSTTKALAVIAYYLSTGELLSSEENKEPIMDYCLADIYPNPFNSEAVINFSMPVNEYVSLKIYDILGNKVETLAEGEMTAGIHEVSFNASSLSSGVYICFLRIGRHTFSKKLVLLK